MYNKFTSKASLILKDVSIRVGEKKCFEIQEEPNFIYKMNEFLLLSFTSYLPPKASELIRFIEQSNEFKYKSSSEKLFIAIVFLYKWHKDVNLELGLADDNHLYKILEELELEYSNKNRNSQIHTPRGNIKSPISNQTAAYTYNPTEKKKSPKYFILGLLSIFLFIYLGQDIDHYDETIALMVGMGLFFSVIGTIAGLGYWRVK